MNQVLLDLLNCEDGIEFSIEVAEAIIRSYLPFRRCVPSGRFAGPIRKACFDFLAGSEALSSCLNGLIAAMAHRFSKTTYTNAYGPAVGIR